MATWEYEGIQCYVASGPDTNHIPIYRAWNGSDHFYTSSDNEYSGLPRGYNKEGVRFYLSGSVNANHVPFYRLYQPNADDHMYTTSASERDNARAHGWRYEGIIGYGATTRLPGHVPLYRSYNPQIRDHFYTTSAQELAAVGAHVPDADIPPSREAKTGFDPATHGFLFPNSFSISPSLLGLDLGEWNMGLCGGMSLAAVQAFNEGRGLSRRTTVPPQGSALFNNLLQLQIETIPSQIIAKVYDWQSSPDLSQRWTRHSIGYRTKREWSKIEASLNAGKPVVLLLIRVQGYFADISKNHQVVAIGYKVFDQTNVRTIQIYDPNHPRGIGDLVVTWGLPRSRLNAHQLPVRPGQGLRGYFLNHEG